MIPIKEEAVDNFISMQQRENNAKHCADLIKQILENNKPLADAIIGCAKKVIEHIDNFEIDDTMSRELKIYVFSNIIYTALAVYKTIEIQLEANELTEIYGDYNDS